METNQILIGVLILIIFLVLFTNHWSFYKGLVTGENVAQPSVNVYPQVHSATVYPNVSPHVYPSVHVIHAQYVPPSPNPSPSVMGGCKGTRYGCCPNGVTPRYDQQGSNC
jgi:hypothetical protein